MAEYEFSAASAVQNAGASRWPCENCRLTSKASQVQEQLTTQDMFYKWIIQNVLRAVEFFGNTWY